MADLLDIILSDSDIIKNINDREDIYFESELGFPEETDNLDNIDKNVRLISLLLNHIFSAKTANGKLISTPTPFLSPMISRMKK